MKVNVILFTQTMHSLLKSSLTLQDSLKITAEISSSKADKIFCLSLLKEVNEGKKLSTVLKKYKGMFSPLYIALVKIGEETGTLTEVFAKLNEYLKNKKSMNQKIKQSLAYPLFVLFMAMAVIMLIIFFVFPRLNEIFEAFAQSSVDLKQKVASVKTNLYISSVVIIAVAIFGIACILLHKMNSKIAFAIDSVLLKIPFIKNLITIIQMQDFAFAMKLLILTHFPLVQSLSYAAGVLTNKKLQKSVLEVCEDIISGKSVGDSFEKQSVFPAYLTVWVKIAERNGDTENVFSQISEYYSNESEGIASSVTAFAEPVLTLITGLIIILLMGQIIIPVFNMLGAL